MMEKEEREKKEYGKGVATNVARDVARFFHKIPKYIPDIQVDNFIRIQLEKVHKGIRDKRKERMLQDER